MLAVGRSWFMQLHVDTGELTTVESLEKLEQLLDRTSGNCDPDRPIIATIEYPHECRVDIGLGASESIVIVWPRWQSDDSDTNFVTVGSKDRSGTKWFWLQGSADTEFEARHLIPVEQARSIVRNFIASGNRSDDVAWETQHY